MRPAHRVFLLSLTFLLGACGPGLDEPRPREQVGLASAMHERSTAAEALSTQVSGSGSGAVGGRTPAYERSAAQRVPPPTATMGGAPAMSSTGGAAGTAPEADAQITARVRAELAAARDLGDVRIDVDTREGVVTLSGPVKTAAAKARAAEIARTVRGVVDVNDQLTLVIG